MTRVVIDTDPGTDDAIALMMALNSPDLDVLGLTTVGGNARLAYTTRNALRLTHFMGRPDLPVSRGAARPLRGRFEYGYYFHGPGGMTARIPPCAARPHPLRAPDFIASLAEAHQGFFSLIALGPLTNVARAILQEPWLAGWIEEIVVMGGAVEVEGNVTPHAEFNIYNDPEAARIVLSSGAPVRLIGLDVCFLTFVLRDELPWLKGKHKNPHLASRILANWFGTHPDSDRYHLCDPLSVAAAIDPHLLTYRRAEVRVETEDSAFRGRTVGRWGDGPVRVAVGVDVDRSLDLMRRLLAQGPSDGG